MAQHRGDGNQHRQHAHGERDGTHAGFVGAVLGVLLQFVGFVGFHGEGSPDGCRWFWLRRIPNQITLLRA